MPKKTVVYFDASGGRRLLMDLTFKKVESVNFYSYENYDQESFRLADLRPDLIIQDQDKADERFVVWILGKEIALPFNPLDLRDKVLEFLDLSKKD